MRRLKYLIRNSDFGQENQNRLLLWIETMVFTNRNQLTLGSCTAHAGIGIVEYFEKRAYGRHIEGSRLFLYKTTRNLMQETGDTGHF